MFYNNEQSNYEVQNVVLGAGIAGLGYAANSNPRDVAIFEKEEAYGGLCRSFQISGFTFDLAVHLSFSQLEEVKKIFRQTEYFVHQPLAYNFHNGKWLKHPIIHNLFPLELEEKVRYLTDLIQRDSLKEVKDYQDWLEASYGIGLSRDFYSVYTEKYWACPPYRLSTSWIGKRLTAVDYSKALRGAMSEDTGIDYYAKEMRYPKVGGYQSFLRPLAEGAQIFYGKEAVKINLEKKEILFKDGTTCSYSRLISSLPLPEMVKICHAPEEIGEASSHLHATAISLVSVAFSRPDVARHLWFYIYDRDILAARVYAPGLKSSANVPEGCSSLQFEIYHYSQEEANRERALENVRYAIQKMELASEEDILFMDYRYLPYGNVIFENGMETYREKVKGYFERQGVRLIGRFGKWEYFWSDQSYQSGMECALRDAKEAIAEEKRWRR